MSDCCDPVPYRRFFNRREAERRLRRYRKRGLDGMASRLVGYLEERGVDNRTILEIGGGLGDLQVELLKAGAAASVNVELSAGYEDAASQLMAEEHLQDRVERRLGDFVEQKDLVDVADLVVLNRVICCYPWMERMMDAAVAKTGWLLALAVPRDRWPAHFFIRVGNWINHVRSCHFRAFVHPVAEIEAIALGCGMRKVFSETDLVWEGMVFERS